MTDDLVKRLRKVCPEAPGDDRTRWHLNPDGPEAADRIEFLERELEEERRSREAAAAKVWEFAERIKEQEREVQHFRDAMTGIRHWIKTEGEKK